MEGAQFNDRLGQQIMPIQKTRQPKNRPSQARHAEYEFRKPVCVVIVLNVLVLLDGGANLFRHGKHRVLRFQIHLQRGLVRRAVRPGLQDHKAEAEVVPLVDPPVHHEIVDLWIFQHCAVIGGHQQAHVGHGAPLPPLCPDIVPDRVLIQIFFRPVLGVIPLWHDMGKRLHDGSQIPYSRSVWSHSHSSCFLTVSSGVNVSADGMVSLL